MARQREFNGKVCDEIWRLMVAKYYEPKVFGEMFNRNPQILDDIDNEMDCELVQRGIELEQDFKNAGWEAYIGDPETTPKKIMESGQFRIRKILRVYAPEFIADEMVNRITYNGSFPNPYGPMLGEYNGTAFTPPPTNHMPNIINDLQRQYYSSGCHTSGSSEPVTSSIVNGSIPPLTHSIGEMLGNRMRREASSAYTDRCIRESNRDSEIFSREYMQCLSRQSYETDRMVGVSEGEIMDPNARIFTPYIPLHMSREAISAPPIPPVPQAMQPNSSSRIIYAPWDSRVGRARNNEDVDSEGESVGEYEVEAS